MGKRNDLSNLLSQKVNYNNKRPSQYHQNLNNFNSLNKNSSNELSDNSPNTLQKKGAEVAMRAAGVPKGLSKEIANNEKTYELANKANIILKFPKKIKLVLTALIIGMPIIFLMLFVVLFNKENSNNDGFYALGQTCETVSVTNTENYRYDEDISFDEYIQGVVAAESDGNNNLEYLKLLSIYARTYFFENASSSCEVEGNSNFQKYMNVNDSSNSKLVKQAVEETKDLVITIDGELLEIDYSSGCLVNKDSNFYYIRYIELLSGEKKYQQIPQNWASTYSVEIELDNLYQDLDKSESEYQNRTCPKSTTDKGLSKIGALYLISNENYDYQNVIKYYNGNDVEIIKNEINYSGNGEFINPTSTIYCSSPYGNRTNPTTGESEFHYGIDIVLPQGTPIYATKDGQITKVEKNVVAINNCDYSYGNYIIIDHEDGLSTLYGHMKYGSIPDSITVGTTVTQGEQIGQIGSTGCSTGYHLHYEVRENGSFVDPANYLDLTNAGGNCQR